MAAPSAELYLRLLADEVLDRAYAATAVASSPAVGQSPAHAAFGAFTQVVRGFRVARVIDDATAGALVADCQLALGLRHLPGGVLAPPGRREIRGPAAPRASHYPERVVPCALRYEFDDTVVTATWIVQTGDSLELAVRSIRSGPLPPEGSVEPMRSVRPTTRLIAALPPRLSSREPLLPADLEVHDNVGRPYSLTTLATAGSSLERRAFIGIEPMPPPEVEWLEFRRGDDPPVRVALDATPTRPGTVGHEVVEESGAERYLAHLLAHSAGTVPPGWIQMLFDAFVEAGLVPAGFSAAQPERDPERSEGAGASVREADRARPLGLTLVIEDHTVILVGMRSGGDALEVEIYVAPWTSQGAASMFADPPWFSLEDSSQRRIPGRVFIWGSNAAGGWGVVVFEGASTSPGSVRLRVETPTACVYADLEVPTDG